MPNAGRQPRPIKAPVVWISGIPASGKSTAARALFALLRARGDQAEIVDGEDVRGLLPPGTVMDDAERHRQMRRLSYTARALARNGVWAVVASGSHLKAIRAGARREAEMEGIPFYEAFTTCPLNVAEGRDLKGRYKAAREGTLRGVPGVDAPYEQPETALGLETVQRTPGDCGGALLRYVDEAEGFAQPVILLGKRGCGTRLLGALAQDAGVWIGDTRELGPGDDSLEWMPLVHELLAARASSGKAPAGEATSAWIRGVAGEILGRAGRSPLQPWGFKVPEVLLVAEPFLQAFPRAKVFNLIRHPVSACLSGVDVCADPEHPLGRLFVPGAYAAAGLAEGSWKDHEPWRREAYVYRHVMASSTEFLRKTVPADRYLEIRFEEIYASADAVLDRIAERIGGRGRPRASTPIDRRIVPYWNPADPQAKAVWEIAGDAGAALGYRPDGLDY